MISAKGVKRYCNSMYAAGAVYLWGADGQIVTKELIETLKKRFGADYYKDVDLATVEGRIGADCSGFLTALSGIDTTAAGYYEKCKVKGKAADLPANKVCLLFRQEKENIVHVAVYTGDGRLTEMWDGCEQREFKPSQWTFYGISDWIEQKEEKKTLAVGDKVEIGKELKGYTTAANAVSGKNASTRVVPGTYYVYKIYGGSVNVSKAKGKPGSWVVLPN